VRVTLPLCLVLLIMLGACQRPESDFVHDPSGYLDAAAKTRIASLHRALLRDGDIHFRLEILPEASDHINREAVQLFDTYRLGETTRAARGVLLLVDPMGEQVRLEIGSDLEGVFPDGFVGYVEEQQLAPFFRSGRVGEGVEATVELLVARAMDEKAFDPSTLPAAPHLSGGGGARINVSFGSSNPDAPPAANLQDYLPGATPHESLQVYMEILSRGVTDPQLPLYTLSTRTLLETWLVTRAQQQQELRRLETGFASLQEHTAEELAVIRFPVERRELPPYFLRRAPAGWQLDLETMSRCIGFNHKNQWHFRTMPQDFEFAFDDWSFDRYGFPHAR